VYGLENRNQKDFRKGKRLNDFLKRVEKIVPEVKAAVLEEFERRTR